MMKGRSLKVRLFLVGAVVIFLALAITGFGLSFLFERHVERRMGAELDTYITQIASRLSFDETGKPHLNGRLADPRFDKIYGGLYWQVNNETAGISVRSRSLWDVDLVLPIDTPGYGIVHAHKASGPENTSLLVHERRLKFNAPQGQQVARLIVAIDMGELKRLSRDFAEDVAVALLALFVFLLIAGGVQVAIGLRPLSLVKSSIVAIRDGTAARIDENFPIEVSPLTNEVNNLLQAQETAMENARHRASDMAHGFKTPLTALKSDIKKLRNEGRLEIAQDIENISNVMLRQIERELTKVRIRNTATMPGIKLRPIIDVIAATLKRTPDGEEKQILLDCDPAIQVKMDKDDLTEILGNLIENSVKYAERTIRVSATKKSGHVIVEIDDDGEGITNKHRELATKRGVRLDQSHAGTGLGLAIVKDILEVYDEKLMLKSSSMGGLKASFKLSAPYST